MSLQLLLLLVGGLVLLVAGGEALVRGAVRVAGAAGISPLIIGLTVVAFGTSAPEMAVSVQAGLAGNAGIALANVVGSNIFNVLLIGGLCALILPLAVDQQLVRMDVPIMIGASLVAYTMALDGRLSRLDGAILFAGVIAYTVYGVQLSRRETAAVQAEYAQEFGRTAPERAGWLTVALNIGLIGVGLVVLVIGSRLLVRGAVELATAWGVSDTVIGLTIIAGGTSLPELAASLIATVRKERDIAVGNLIGSNIFNLLAILGLSGLVTPGGLTTTAELVRVDLLVMIGVAIACLPIFFKGAIARWEGAFFLACYVVYTVYLVFNATQSPNLAGFRELMLTYGLPLIGIVVLMTGWRALHSARLLDLGQARS